MTPSPPDAGRYADGPLDPTSRRAFDPDPPTRADWKRVSDGIAARVLPRRTTVAGRIRRRAAAGLALAGCALVAALLYWGGGNGPNRDAPARDVMMGLPELDPLAEFAVLPIASDDELRIATLRGDWGTGLVVGAHPLAGDLRLATADELTVGRAPDGMESVPDSGDVPALLFMKTKRTDE